MSRVIKFRIWLAEPRAMSPTVTISEMVNSFLSTITPMPEPNDRLVLMQYTGLKDKNGVEIYEGDILATPKGNGKVTWEEGQYWFECVDTWPYNLRKQEDILGETIAVGYDASNVIGNIYENPELLEKAS